MATPDEVKLQKGTIAPTQKEQTGSAKAVSLIESLAAGKPSLPVGSTISPQLQNVATTELMPATTALSGQTASTGLAATVAGVICAAACAVGATAEVPVTAVGVAIVGAVGAVGTAAAKVPVTPGVAINSVVATFCSCGDIVVPLGKLGVPAAKLSIKLTALALPVCSF